MFGAVAKAIYRLVESLDVQTTHIRALTIAIEKLVASSVDSQQIRDLTRELQGSTKTLDDVLKKTKP